MPRFFVAEPTGDVVSITGEDAQHISKSLRMQVGDDITLSDSAGWDYLGNITQISNQLVEVTVTKKLKNTTEPKVAVTLYQALPKGDKFSFIVEKAVELGAVEIVPVLTSRCISRPKDKSMERKIERFQKTAEEAAKQSSRGKIPLVRELISYKEALEEMKQADLSILFYEEATKPLKEILTAQPEAKSIAIFVGSEGGFSSSEVAEAKEHKLQVASLGNRILRCETAPITALSALFYAYDEF